MTTDLTLDGIYTPSENIVARLIEGEVMIVPLTAGIGESDEGLYTLNECGQAIWQQLDGRQSLRAVAAQLAAEYEAAEGEIEADVLGLARELLERGILAEVK